MATERIPERSEAPPPGEREIMAARPTRRDPAPTPEPLGMTEATQPATADGVPLPTMSSSPRPAQPGGRRPGTDRLAGPPRPPQRELDTNGVPIVRRKGTVADIHRRAQKQIQHQRERQVERAAEAPPPGEASVPRDHRLERAPGPASPPAPPGRPPADARPPLPPRPAPASDDHRADDLARSALLASGPTRSDPPPSAPPPRPAPPPAASRPANLVAADGAPPGKLNPEWVALWRATYLEREPLHRCVTCRSFRAGDNHGPGWCSNTNVFPTPQFVNPDDLACLGPLGDWWLESDRRWLATAGTIPTEPTPLTDGLIQLLSSMPRSMRRR